MNQLNQLLQQMRTLFAGMTPQSRLLAVLMTIGIVVSAGFLVQNYTGSTGAMVYLFDGKSLKDSELDRIEIAFSDAGLRSYDRIGNRIKIPASNRDVYYKAISEGKAIPIGMGGAVEAAMNSIGIMDSAKTTEAKYLRARLEDLGNNIKQMDSLIQDADVKYDERRDGFSADRKQTATVALKTKAGHRLSLEQQHSIIRYVAGNFAGLKQSDVTLLDLNDSTATRLPDDPSSIAQAKYYQVKRQQEDDYRRRAENLLIDYGNVRVDVAVDIDPTLNEETDTLTYNDKPTTIQSTTTKKDAVNQKFSPGGRPGTEPNALANKGASLNNNTPDQNNTTKELTENDKRVTGNTLTRREMAGLQTKRVAFTVAVPYSYYQKAYAFKKKSADPTWKPDEKGKIDEADLKTIKDETQTSIQAKLSPIMPVGAAGEDKYPRVTVTDYLDMAIPEPPSIPASRIAMIWISESWQTLALFGLAGVALLSLRSFVKSAPGSNDAAFERGFDLPLDDAADIDLSSLTDEDNELYTQPASEESSTPRLRTTGGDVKNDLTAMVRENPDAAATLLRNWIGGTT
jgi:flagellar M-ring protein FliF